MDGIDESKVTMENIEKLVAYLEKQMSKYESEAAADRYYGMDLGEAKNLAKAEAYGKALDMAQIIFGKED